MTDPDKIHWLTCQNTGERLAYQINKGPKTKQAPFIIWCGGLRSDMEGGKATHLHNWAIESEQNFIRFDYFGHGVSGGDFKQGHIGIWSENIIQIIDELCENQPVILIGSSMGGWASLLAARKRVEQVKGLLLIAPAPDFTQKLMWPGFSDDIKEQILSEGVYYEPSPYGEPLPISKILIEESAKYQLLDAPIDLDIPIRILQGMKDEPVPWEHALKLVDKLTGENIELTLVKSGDHSLSRPSDLMRLTKTIKELVGTLTHNILTHSG